MDADMLEGIAIWLVGNAFVALLVLRLTFAPGLSMWNLSRSHTPARIPRGSFIPWGGWNGNIGIYRWCLLRAGCCRLGGFGARVRAWPQTHEEVLAHFS